MLKTNMIKTCTLQNLLSVFSLFATHPSIETFYQITTVFYLGLTSQFQSSCILLQNIQDGRKRNHQSPHAGREEAAADLRMLFTSRLLLSFDNQLLRSCWNCEHGIQCYIVDAVQLWFHWRVVLRGEWSV